MCVDGVFYQACGEVMSHGRPASLEPETRTWNPHWNPRHLHTCSLSPHPPPRGSPQLLSVYLFCSFLSSVPTLVSLLTDKTIISPFLKSHSLRPRAGIDRPDMWVTSSLSHGPTSVPRTVASQICPCHQGQGLPCVILLWAGCTSPQNRAVYSAGRGARAGGLCDCQQEKPGLEAEGSGRAASVSGSGAESIPGS